MKKTTCRYLCRQAAEEEEEEEEEEEDSSNDDEGLLLRQNCANLWDVRLLQETCLLQLQLSSLEWYQGEP
jgi:hypothetical protein